MALPSLEQDFKPDLNIDRKDLGRADTLRFNILTFVVEENYDRAIHELNTFLEKDFEYPRFRNRIERYVQHATDLVSAIRAKRRFPGVQMLTMAKQQELNEKFRAHFMALQYVLKKIEKIQTDVRIEDVRSTVWIVKAFINSLFIIFLVACALDFHRGLFTTTVVVVDDVFQEITNWVFHR